MPKLIRLVERALLQGITTAMRDIITEQFYNHYYND